MLCFHISSHLCVLVLPLLIQLLMMPFLFPCKEQCKISPTLIVPFHQVMQHCCAILYSILKGHCAPTHTGLRSSMLLENVDTKTELLRNLRFSESARTVQSHCMDFPWCSVQRLAM